MIDGLPRPTRGAVPARWISCRRSISSRLLSAELWPRPSFAATSDVFRVGCSAKQAMNMASERWRRATGPLRMFSAVALNQASVAVRGTLADGDCRRRPGVLVRSISTASRVARTDISGEYIRCDRVQLAADTLSHGPHFPLRLLVQAVLEEVPPPLKIQAEV